MEDMELICFQIISAVGSARSSYIEAIQEAKHGDYKAAKEMIKKGSEVFIEGHKAHAKLLQEVAVGKQIELSLLLMHAEDQLMSAESFKIVAEEFISLYESFSK